MSSKRIFGLILVIVGVLLLLFGLRAADSVVETAQDSLSGTYTDMWYQVGGSAMVLVGIALTLFGGRERLRSP
jgi:Sec-independent protein translocase protein TatA